MNSTHIRNNPKGNARSNPSQASRRQKWIPKGSTPIDVNGDLGQRKGNGETSHINIPSLHPRGTGFFPSKKQVSKPSNSSKKIEVSENREQKGTTDSKMNLPQLVQEIEGKLIKGTVECMICYDMVRRTAPIWSCSSCYSIFHLNCIKKWARASTPVDALEENPQGFNWRCPGCQGVQFTPLKDISYVCFCGSRPDPPADMYLTPHSCGESCGRPLEKNVASSSITGDHLCPHLCVLQCHPGPCPPCKAIAPPRLCPCGKKIITTQCSNRKSVLSCGQQCDKILGCWRHRCQRICHTGPCDFCEVLLDASCFCKKESKPVQCENVDVKGEVDLKDGVFSCGAVCGNNLRCGNHECIEVCHPDSCGDCELMPDRIKSCFCGKTKLGEERQSCLDPIPTCSQICQKLLPCKLHNCKEPCHSGDCEPCSSLVTQKCRCGSTYRTVECYKTAKEVSFTCDKPCGRKKNCGRHRCSERCCPLSDPNTSVDGIWDPHLCAIVCAKKLRCGQHYCDSLCHSGHCPPCQETIFSDLTCACGKMSLPPPLPCGTPPPLCSYPCLVAQPCGHTESHSCHFGDCPPCPIPVGKECVGGHVVLRNIPCGSKDIRCNEICGKTRQCGIHSCARTCHSPPCDLKSEPFLKASCGQVCGAPRTDCKHTCTSLCHPSSPCPDMRCEFPVTISCSCGRITAKVPCDVGGFNTNTVLEAYIALQPVEANGRKTPLGHRKLICDDECAKMERKRVLADAFDVTRPSLDSLHFSGSSDASDPLLELFHRDPKWALSVEERCRFLVLSKSKSLPCPGIHVFCPMSKEKRDMVNLIAARWKLSVISAGWEPKRFIVIRVTPKSKAPARILGTKVSSLTTAPPHPLFDQLMDIDPMLVVALLDVSGDSDISALVLRFGGECELLWLNDKNALAVFSDRARAATAMRRLDYGSAYHGASFMLQNGGSSGTCTAWGGPGCSTKASSGSNAWCREPDLKGNSTVFADASVWKSSEASSITTSTTVLENRWNVLNSSNIVATSEGDSDPRNRIMAEVKPCLIDGSKQEVADNWEEAYE